MNQSKKARFLKWCDGWALTGMGILKSMRDWRFWVGFIIAFLAFGTLMNLLANGLGIFATIWRMDFGGKMMVVGNAILGIFGLNMAFADWILNFSIALLQGVLIGLLVVVCQHKKAAKKRSKATAAEAETGAQNAGLAAGLAVLGSGCPTCGTTLLAPVIGAISSTGSYALASTLSGVLLLAAIVIALLTIKKTGEEAYVIIVSEEYEARQSRKKQKEDKK